MSKKLFWGILIAAVVVLVLPIPIPFENLMAKITIIADCLILTATSAKKVQEASALLTSESASQGN